MKKMRAGVLLLAVWLACGNAWAGVAGRVQFVSGTVQMTSAGGAERTLKKGDVVSEGDTLISGQYASAQIRMRDGGFIAVRPDTRLKFDDFKFNGKEDGSERGFFSLLKGGFRAITGLIGRVNKQNYRITTPAATIGIRGTDHETLVLTPDHPLVLAGTAEAGTYSKVNSGETTLMTGAGTIIIPPNRMGFAPGMDQLPKMALVDSRLFAVVPAPPPGANGMQKGPAPAPKEPAGGEPPPVGEPGKMPEGLSSGELLPPDGTLLPPLPDSTLPPPDGLLPPPLLPPPLVPPAISTTQPAANVQGNAAFSFCAADCVNGFADKMQGVVDTKGGLIGFNTAGGMFGGLGGAMIVQQGRAALATGGNLNWGQWAGPTTINAPLGFVGGTMGSVGIKSLHYIGGEAPTVFPTTGAATFLPVGGTNPTDGMGNVGQFLGGTINVDFGQGTVLVSNLGVAFGGKTFTMASVGPSGFNSANGTLIAAPLTGTCTPTPACTSPSASGDFTGAFIGKDASGIGLVYHVSGSGVDVIGAQGFAK